MDRDKLLDRIRRLLRLAASPNVHEAAVAAATAQELMARHRIEAASLETDPAAHGVVDHRDSPLESSKRLREWKLQLADAIARANGCRIYLRERGKLEDVVLVGRADDAELVRMLYGDLVKRVESLTRRHGEGRDRDFCKAFRLGAVTTLSERFTLAERSTRAKALGAADAGAAPDDEAQALTALGLMRLEARDLAVDRYLEQTLGVREGRARTIRADAEGFARGRLAGHTIALESTDRDHARPSRRRRDP